MRRDHNDSGAKCDDAERYVAASCDVGKQWHVIAVDKPVVRITNRYRTGFCGMLRDKDVVNVIRSF